MFKYHIHKADLFDLQFKCISIAMLDNLMSVVFIYLLHLTKKGLFNILMLWKLLQFAVQENGKVFVVQQN